MNKDLKRLLNKISSWRKDGITVTEDNRILLEDFNGQHVDDLRQQDIDERFSKYQNRNNGGGERAIDRRLRHYHKLSKRKKQELIGKSSRKFNRDKKSWLESGEYD